MTLQPKAKRMSDAARKRRYALMNQALLVFLAATVGLRWGMPPKGSVPVIKPDSIPWRGEQLPIPRGFELAQWSESDRVLKKSGSNELVSSLYFLSELRGGSEKKGVLNLPHWTRVAAIASMNHDVAPEVLAINTFCQRFEFDMERPLAVMVQVEDSGAVAGYWGKPEALLEWSDLLKQLPSQHDLADQIFSAAKRCSEQVAKPAVVDGQTP